MADLGRRHGHTSRYSRYTGGPDPLAPPIDLRDALEQIGQSVMEGSSPRRALSELMRRGTEGMRGTDRLAAEANRKRRELLQRHNLDGTLQEIKKLLDEAVLAERKELARALDDDARFGELQMEALSPSPAKAVQELADYDWRSPEARQKYEQIKDLLGREMLDQRFAGMKEALENATDEDRQRVNEMLDDLNDLLDKHAQGKDTAEDFQQFMDKHGEFFPEGPRNIDELLDSLAKRAAAAQRFRNSLSAEQRAELDSLAQQAFGSPSLMNALNRLDAHLQAARPGEDWSGSERFSGGDPLGMGEGAQALSDIAELEQLADALSQSYSGRRWMTWTLRRWPASSVTTPRSTRARCPSWRKPWSIKASSTVAPTGSGGFLPRPCASSAKPHCAMWRNAFRVGTASGTRAGPVRRGS
ncbi:von Willebrand factor type A [Mycolicibacterium fortuitum]|uniref:von Willebrand factor type A n=1 Tax=Mycolicibacterium fortuitum TaxID=1766 RepID=A0A378UV24_MYCFO|nr:von Willebrand factor type A [Mycolicibacterium fortuitum]